MRKPDPPPMVEFVKGAQVPTWGGLLRGLLVSIVIALFQLALWAALR